MNIILNTILSILIPIFFGFLIKNLKVFQDGDSLIIRKFVIRCTVPFIIFKNLYSADISEFSQLLPCFSGFLLITIFYFVLVYILYDILKISKPEKNSFSFSTMYGNYGYMGWGVVNSFYGEKGLNRSIFFTIFFWPIFLITGFLFIFLKNHKGISKKVFFKTTLINASIPIISAILGILFNFFNIILPQFILNFISSFSSLTIPLILFTIGLELNLKLNFSDTRLIFLSLIIRLLLSQIFGLITIIILKIFIKNIDTITIKVILIETVMPTATMTPFFSEYTESNRSLISSIITFSTLISLVTIPIWYVLIEKFLINLLK
ncbi:MAG: AEC family transporter [Spirochaetes bacterium]|nr:AEC family transporter [Spirochaetota bacterium]